MQLGVPISPYAWYLIENGMGVKCYAFVEGIKMKMGVLAVSPRICIVFALIFNFSEPTRGRGRGRGRGERGRGRGRGRGQIQQKFSSFRLDNRQPAFVLSDMPAGNLQDQVLRDHFTVLIVHLFVSYRYSALNFVFL